MNNILILGNPGDGKTTSLRHLDPKSTVILTPNSKPLPWMNSAKDWSKSNKNLIPVTDFKSLDALITSALKSKRYKVIVIEDLTHYFTHRIESDIEKKSYDKWTDLAIDAYRSILKKASDSDTTLVVIGHTTEQVNAQKESYIGLQTPGRMLTNTIRVDSYFITILHSLVEVSGEDVEYQFLTNSDGIHLAKSPMKMLDKKIPNDLNYVIQVQDKYLKGEDFSNIEPNLD